VTWNRTSQEWLCCGAISNDIKCNNPTTITVSAKALASIATTYVVPSQVATTEASGTVTPSNTRGPTATSATNTPTNTGGGGKRKKKSGTPVGAIVGGVVGGVAVIALLIGAWIFWRRKRTAKAGGGVAMSSELGSHREPVEKGQDVVRSELPVHEDPVELSALSPHAKSNRPAELPT
jgi:hypothetical protein